WIEITKIILWRSHFLRFCGTAVGVPLSDAVPRHSFPPRSCTPAWIFLGGWVFFYPTIFQPAFLFPLCPPIMSPTLSSGSISESKAPSALTLRARAGWEKTRPSAPMPHTRNSRSTGTRGCGFEDTITPVSCFYDLNVGEQRCDITEVASNNV